MRHFLVAGFTALIITGCASLEPDPCSAEWIEWKTDRVLNQFANQNADSLRDLRKFSSTLSEGDVGPLTALRIPAMIESFKTLALDFRDTALPELNAAVEQCGSAEKLVPAFTAFLADQDIDDSVLEWIEVLGTLVVDAD